MTPILPLPELLAPAGSPDALEEALRAGADAVYLGGSRFNARMNAHNFDAGQLREAVIHAHTLGGRVYLTLNTLVWDRELPDALEAAYEAAACGVDALIIADLGAAAVIRRALPGLPLHASTQLSGHNARMGEVLAPLGFSRFVIARETTLSDLRTAVRNNPLEVEVFIHGALCVSHSGQCLFSSVVGGRSGNRGECAQPCRLPYGCSSGAREERGRGTREKNYPLSLKDLSLAGHVPALIEAGVASLKIEGRMKSPAYVGGVTAIWRRLLDERRAATPDETAALGELFSRGGFTDGYQIGCIDHRMMGVRSEADKERTAAAERAALTAKHPPRLPVDLTFSAAVGEPTCLTATAPLYRQGGLDPHIGGLSRDDTAAAAAAAVANATVANATVANATVANATVANATATDATAADATAATGDLPGHAAGTATVTVTVTGDMPTASDRPVAAVVEAVEKQLSRTGGTPYTVQLPPRVHIRAEADGRTPNLPLSSLNALRRAALEQLDVARLAAMPRREQSAVGGQPLPASRDSAATPPATPLRTARFRNGGQITPMAVSYFDRIDLPLGRPFPEAVPREKRGVILPPVVFDREAEAVAGALTEAVAAGIRHLTVGNLGHLPLIREAAARADIGMDALSLHGDFRFNVANTPTAVRLSELGLSTLLLSPELTIPRMRDIARGSVSAGAIVYGRLPLMLLEKCAIRAVESAGDSREPNGAAAVCRNLCARDAAVMTDRMGKRFPILREDSPAGRGHRNVVFNSIPLSMSDRMDDLARAGLWVHHFLFSTESPREVDDVIAAYRDRRPLGGEVRRMLK